MGAMMTDFRSSHQAAFYLSGLIDGDGWIVVTPQRVIGVACIDRDIIDGAARAFETLGARYRRRIQPRSPHKDLFVIEASGRNSFAILASSLQLVHPLKAKKLSALVASYQSFGCRSCGVDLNVQGPGCPVCYSRHYARRTRRG